MAKSLVIVANDDASQPLGKFLCDKCGNDIIGTRDTISTCPFCGEEFETEVRAIKASLTATLTSGNSIAVTCADCSADLSVYNSDNTATEFSISKFCPICGGQNLEETPEPEEEQEQEQVEETQEQTEFTPSVCKDGSCDELAGCDEEAISQEIQESKEEAVAETEEDVRETLDNNAVANADVADIDVNNLQWKTVNDEQNGPEGTLIAFSASTGNPLFVFRKKNCSSDIQDIFASPMMLQAFNQIANNEGIGTAVTKFGGRTFNTREVMKSNYIDSLVDTKVKQVVIPKFIECMALVVDGAIKGIYSDVGSDINNAMTNELVGAGLPRERVESAVAATFGSGGTTVFASILAKAVKLMQEPEAIFENSKSMIASAQGKSELDVEQQHVRQALNANVNNIVLGNTLNSPTSNGNQSVNRYSGFDDDVKKLREQLKFSTKLR